MHTNTDNHQIWDFVNSELIHNKTYAHRLPPTFIEQARGYANLREDAIYSDKAMGGIGNSSSPHPSLFSPCPADSERSRQSRAAPRSARS